MIRNVFPCVKKKRRHQVLSSIKPRNAGAIQRKDEVVTLGVRGEAAKIESVHTLSTVYLFYAYEFSGANGPTRISKVHIQPNL